MVKKCIKGLAALLLCLSILAPSAMAKTNGTDHLKAAFIGNATLLNEQVVPYSDILSAYIQSVTNTPVLPVCTAPINFGDDTVRAVAEAAGDADVVFIELDLSKKYTASYEEISSKLEAVLMGITTGGKRPAVYFIYTPEETFLDYREPFDKVAQHYDIPIVDVFKAWQREYQSGQKKTSDFLTAGLIPSEAGHSLLADEVILVLKSAENILKPIKDVSPMTSYEKYLTEPQPKENVQIKTDGTEIYVSSKEGNDNNSGTITSPLKTPKAARDKVRQIIKAQGKNFEGATVYFREGTYNMSKSLALTKEDSGTDTAGIVYQAYPGESVRMVGGKTLSHSDFKPVKDIKALKRLPVTSAGKVLVYDLGAKGIDPGTYLRLDGSPWNDYYMSEETVGLGNLLIVGGKMETRSRYPNAGVAYVSHETPTTAKYIGYNVDKGETWETAEDAWVWATLAQGYRTEAFKVASFDTANKIINFSHAPSYTGRAGWNWYMVNLLEELDMPGEWFTDVKNKLLYYYPRDNFAESEIIYSTMSEPIICMQNTKNIVVKDIIFEANCESAIKIVDGNDNKIKDCTLRNLGKRAIEIQCSDIVGPGGNGVEGCDIYDTAFGGVVVSGGDRYGLTPQGDYVDNCMFENYSSEIHQSGAAVTFKGTVGAKVTNCNFHNDDSLAIAMQGNDDYIAYNEIYNVVKNTDDYGAIYGDHRGAQRQGVVFTHNLLHHIDYNLDVDSPPVGGLYKDVMGFYCDAGRNMGARVMNNAFVGVMRPVFFSNNQNMMAKENLYIDTKKEIVQTTKAWSNDVLLAEKQAKLEQQVADGTFMDVAGQGESKAIDNLLYRAYQSSPEFTKETEKTYYLKYPWLEQFLYNHPLELRNILVKNNAAFNAQKGVNIPQSQVDYVQVHDNYFRQQTITEEEAGSDSIYARVKKGMEIAAENIEEFEVWDVTEAGADNVGGELGEFNTLYPVNGAKEVDVDDLVLCWDYLHGADLYTATVATDKDFKNVVFEGSTVNNGIKVKNLEYGSKTYYWKVKAEAYSEKFIGTPENANGIQSFSSVYFKEANKQGLGANITASEELVSKMVEGNGAGEYPAGTKAELETALSAAKQLYNNPRTSLRQAENAEEDLHTAFLKALSKVKLSESDGVQKLLGNGKLIWLSKIAASKPMDAELAPDNVIMSDNSITVTGAGGVYTKDNLDIHEVLHFKAKFDFSGNPSASVFSTISIRAADEQKYIYHTKGYFFLVTSTAIELQGYKTPSTIGKFYYNVPNTFIEEGKEHDIQFAAVPVDEGKANRIVLMIDGKIVFDILDTINPIEQGSKMAVWNSDDSISTTIIKADENTGYPNLAELLNDPNSELNQKE